MSKIDYFLMGIDQEGNQIIDVSLTPERAGRILVDLVSDGTCEIKMKELPALDAGGGGAVMPEIEEKPKGSKGENGGNVGKQPVCAECGSGYGYHKKKCSQNKLTPVKEKTARFAVKECCGSKGSRHFGWCKGKNTVDAPLKKEREPLGRTPYTFIRDAMHDKEFQSAKYALVNKLSPWEVNAAVRSTDYENYLSMRAQ